MVKLLNIYFQYIRIIPKKIWNVVVKIGQEYQNVFRDWNGFVLKLFKYYVYFNSMYIFIWMAKTMKIKTNKQCLIISHGTIVFKLKIF